MTVLVVDYGVGNLHSVSRALENLGCSVNVSANPDDIRSAERIVLPGVGSFAEAMAKLNERGWVEPIRHAVRNEEIPILGICLGMQLLGDRGFEVREVEGLGLIPGKVVRLEPRDPSERIPHVGWNDVTHADDPLFSAVPQNADFYFVHSYRIVLEDDGDCIGRSDYCGGFPAAIRRKNTFGVQFHPEKSSHAGIRLLRNFVSYV
jgi:imidazole glycerol-phosphate synthase subunit HisH